MAEAQPGLRRNTIQARACACPSQTNPGRLDQDPHETHILTPVTQLQAFFAIVNRGEAID